MEKPASEKLTHAAVEYENRSTHDGNCAACKHFIEANPPRCEGIKSPISSKGWCIRFEPKPLPFLDRELTEK